MLKSEKIDLVFFYKKMFVGKVKHAELTHVDIILTSKTGENTDRIDFFSLEWKDRFVYKYYFNPNFIFLGRYIVNLQFVECITWAMGGACIFLTEGKNLYVNVPIEKCEKALAKHKRIINTWYPGLIAVYNNEGTTVAECQNFGSIKKLNVCGKNSEIKEYLQKFSWDIKSVNSERWYAAPKIVVTFEHLHYIYFNDIKFWTANASAVH